VQKPHVKSLKLSESARFTQIVNSSICTSSSLRRFVEKKRRYPFLKVFGEFLHGGAPSSIFVELLDRVHPQPRLPSRTQLNQTPLFLTAAGTNPSIS
jgi:hypothetical protein